MPWLVGERIVLESGLDPEKALRAFGANTADVWSHNVFDEACVGISLGRFVLAWRTSWRRFAFLPGPVFRGRITPKGDGCQLAGYFTVPAWPALAAILLAAFPLCGLVAAFVEFRESLTHLALGLLLVALVSVPVGYFARFLLSLPWWFADADQVLVARHLRLALESPAA